MIKRISDLPSIEEVKTQTGDVADLSNCVFEVSFTADEGITYHSARIQGLQIADAIIQEFQNRVIDTLVISSELLLSGAVLKLLSSDLILSGGSNIFSWPNIDPNGKDTSCYLQFDRVKIYGRKELELSSGGPLNIYSGTEPIEYPVVINDNLSVYRYLTKTENPVDFPNTDNNIQCKSVSINSLASYPNNAVNCGMLNDTIGYINTQLADIDRGNGAIVTVDRTLTLTTNNSNGTVIPEGTTRYSNNATVSIQATPKTGYEFIGWTGDYTGISQNVTITMNSSKNIVANFSGGEDPEQQEFIYIGQNSQTITNDMNLYKGTYLFEMCSAGGETSDKINGGTGAYAYGKFKIYTTSTIKKGYKITIGRSDQNNQTTRQILFQEYINDYTSLRTIITLTGGRNNTTSETYRAKCTVNDYYKDNFYDTIFENGLIDTNKYGSSVSESERMGLKWISFKTTDSKYGVPNYVFDTELNKSGTFWGQNENINGYCYIKRLGD